MHHNFSNLFPYNLCVDAQTEFESSALNLKAVTHGINYFPFPLPSAQSAHSACTHIYLEKFLQ